MAPYVDAARNLAANALDEAVVGFISAHTAYHATGGNEVSGGSYVRKAVVWDAASSGAKAMNANVALDIPASTTVQYIGFWSAESAGTFYGMTPLGSGAAKFFVMPNATNDVLFAKAHGFADTNQVACFGSALPTGITAGTLYYVITDETDSFQLSATSGGGSLELTATGEGTVQRCIPETFGSAGTLTILAASTSQSFALV